MQFGHRRRGSAIVAQVSGRIDHANAESFKTALWPLLAGCAHGGDVVVLDLAQLEYISSAGLRVLMLAAREVQPRGGSLVVAGLQPLVAEIFEITRFNLVLRTAPNVDAALAPPAAAAG